MLSSVGGNTALVPDTVAPTGAYGIVDSRLDNTPIRLRQPEPEVPTRVTDLPKVPSL